MTKKQLLLSVVSLVSLWSLRAIVVFAQEFTSASFDDSNPVVTVSGGKSISTNFQLFSGAGQTVIGQSSSTNFSSEAGFFYFPFVSSPVVSVTAGDAQASLSWTSAVGQLGLNVSGYSIGKSLVSGGPYSFSSLGNVLISTATGLTNGSTYYFVVRALDFFGDPIVTSTEVSVVPVAATVVTGSGSTGGGSGIPVSTPQPQAAVFFSGLAYPKSPITLLKDGQLVAITNAAADSSFQISLTNISAGNYNFVLYAQDSRGNRSSLFSLLVDVSAGAITRINGIFLSPSLGINKSEAKKGGSILVSGQSVPNSDIIFAIDSKNEIVVKTKSDVRGAYFYNINTAKLSVNSYTIKAKAVFNGQVSSYSNAVDFLVSSPSVSIIKPKPVVQPKMNMDFNGDNKVNFVDFSFLLYWYKRPLTAAEERFDLNHDGKIDLVDFSILVYNWTG